MASTEKTLDRIANILAKAENTTFDQERETYLAKAQELATLAGLDLEVARSRTHAKERQAPIQRHIEIGRKGDRGAGAYADLFNQIAIVNDVECIMADSWIDAYGMPNDIDMTEALFAVILNQMVIGCIEYISEGSWRGETSIHDARKSYYEGYRNRVVSRLAQAKRLASRDASDRYAQEGVNTSLVLADKKKEVHDFYWTNAKRLSTRKAVRGKHAGSRWAGDTAGMKAQISKDESLRNKKAIS